MGTVVNLGFPSSNEGSMEISTTVPLIKENFYLIHNKNQIDYQVL